MLREQEKKAAAGERSAHHKDNTLRVVFAAAAAYLVISPAVLADGAGGGASADSAAADSHIYGCYPGVDRDNVYIRAGVLLAGVSGGHVSGYIHTSSQASSVCARRVPL